MSSTGAHVSCEPLRVRGAGVGLAVGGVCGLASVFVAPAACSCVRRVTTGADAVLCHSRSVASAAATRGFALGLPLLWCAALAATCRRPAAAAALALHGTGIVYRPLQAPLTVRC